MKKLNYNKQSILILLIIFNYVINLNGQIVSDTANTSKHYVLSEFVMGSVKLNNGSTEHAMMNYNKLTEEMIFEKGGVMLALDSLVAIDSVNIDSRLFVPHNKIFYEVLVKGPVSLFIQHKCNLMAAGNPAGYGGTTETGAAKNITSLTNTGRAYKLHLPRDYHVTDASKFWIRYKNKYYKSNTDAQIIKVFPDFKNEIKKLIKEKKLDLNNSADMVTLILKCNELVR